MGSKSKKCEDLINKCNSKLNNSMTSCVQPEQTKKHVDAIYMIKNQ